MEREKPMSDRMVVYLLEELVKEITTRKSSDLSAEAIQALYANHAKFSKEWQRRTKHLVRFNWGKLS